MLPIPVQLPTSLTLFFEIFVPGAIGIILAYPLLPGWARIESGTFGYFGLFGLSLLVGVATRLLMLHLVDIALGRYWPPRLRERAIRKLKERADRVSVSTPVDATQQPGLVFPSSGELVRSLSNRFLGTLMNGPDGKKLVVCPTLMGNAAITLIGDLYTFFLGTAILRGGTPSSEAILPAITQAYYAVPPELRTEMRESESVGVGLQRLTVISIGVLGAYLIDISRHPGFWQRDILLAIAMLVVSRITYTAGVLEFLGTMSTVKAVLMRLSESDIRAIQERLSRVAPQSATATSPSSSRAAPISGPQ